MQPKQTCEVDNGKQHPWEHIWALDALYSVMLNHADDVATTTTEDGFLMDFRKGSVSLCTLDHLQIRPRTLFVNVSSVSRELWFALCGIAHENGLEFTEVDETADDDTEE